MLDGMARTPEADVPVQNERANDVEQSGIPGYVLERHLRVDFSAEETALLKEFEGDWRKAPTYADRRLIFRTQVIYLSDTFSVPLTSIKSP